MKLLTSPVKKIPIEKLEEIKDLANEKIEFLLEELGIDINNSVGYNDEIRSSCPIHKGDNNTAFCYNQKFKKWRCYTAGCHENNDNIFGLVKLALSDLQNKEVSFLDSVDWLTTKLGIDIGQKVIEDDYEALELRKMTKISKIEDIQQNKEKFNPFPSNLLKDKIEPSEFFLKEGFSKDILKKYNVGYCDDKFKPMYLRSYAPVLDDEGKLVIGVTGRIKYGDCEYCNSFHEQGKGCPHENKNVKGYSKWKHFGFNSGAVLYNYWFAKDLLKKTGVAVLTEGPKDVWWMEQHGVGVGLGIFGLNITKYHIKKLLAAGVLTIVTGLDKDEFGIRANQKIADILSNYFKIKDLSPLLNDNEDIADIKSEKMIRDFAPFIKSLER